MASLVEVFNRDVLLSYLQPDPMVVSPLVQSGAFASDSRLRPLLTGGSATFTVPSIGGIDGSLESNYSNTILTDIAQPRTITARSQQGRIAFLNEGFVESTLARYLSQVNALELIAGQLEGMWQAQGENRALATVAGLRNFDMANGKNLQLDISKATADATSTFSVDAFIDAEATMGRGQRGSGVMFVHPQIAAKMRKQNLIERVTTSANLPPVDFYNGRAVIETDVNTKVGTGVNAKFVTFLASANAFSYDSVPGPDDLEVTRTGSTGNGAGHRILHTRRNILIHPQGFSFVADEDTLTGGTKNEALSASWGDLQLAANWQLTGSAASVPFRFLITNL